MFISNFNRFFEKHGKKTYIALGVVISAMFVVFVAPGKSEGGCGRSNALGEMYGKKLDGAKMLVKMQEAMIGLWMQNPQYFGYDLNSSSNDLFEVALHRMRMLKAVDKEGIPKTTDDELKSYLASFPAFQKDGRFDAEAFDNFIEYVKGNNHLTAVDFDRIVKENLRIAKLEEQLVADVTVEDSEVDAFTTDYTLKVANCALNTADSLPTEEQVKAFFNEKKADLASIIPQGKRAVVAVFAADQKLAADALSRKYSEAVSGETAEERQKRFCSEASGLGAKCFVTNYLIDALDSIEGFNGDERMLCQKICGLKNVGDVTPLVADASAAAVAMLKDIQTTAIPDELTEKISAPIRTHIMRTKALDYFKKEIKAPYDEAMSQTEAILADTMLSNQEKQSRLSQLDATLPSDTHYFYVSETRDFVYASFDILSYMDQIQPVTDEDLKVAFEERTDSKDKTFDEMKGELSATITTERCREVALAAARKLNDALKADQTEATTLDEYVQKLTVEGSKAKVLTVENAARYDTTKAPAEILQAAFKATPALRTTGIVSNSSTIFVGCLINVTKAHISDPETDDSAMNSALMVYRRSVEMAAAKERATKLYDALKAELTAGKSLDDAAKDCAFIDVPAFMPCDAYLNPERIAAAENAANLVLRYGTLSQELASAEVGTLLKPVEAYRGNGQIAAGYNLVFVADKAVVHDEKIDELAGNYREMLLAQKRQVKLNEYYQKIFDESETYLYKNIR